MMMRAHIELWDSYSIFGMRFTQGFKTDFISHLHERLSWMVEEGPSLRQKKSSITQIDLNSLIEDVERDQWSCWSLLTGKLPEYNPLVGRLALWKKYGF